MGPKRLLTSAKLRNAREENKAVRLQGISFVVEGKQPRPPTKVPKRLLSGKGWSCTDNQDVGLEAATIKRVRNSSLVK